MIALIRSWLIGMTCAAAIVAMAENLMPSGTVRKIGKLTGALVLMLAILRPVLQLDGESFSAILSAYQINIEETAMEMGVENARLMKGIIEERTAAYILDKAHSLGIEQCTIRVTARSGETERDYPVPDMVTVVGELSDEERKALSWRIEADLAIPAERQTYKREEVE